MICQNWQSNFENLMSLSFYNKNDDALVGPPMAYNASVHCVICFYVFMPKLLKRSQSVRPILTKWRIISGNFRHVQCTLVYSTVQLIQMHEGFKGTLTRKKIFE
jgi:hypothetical protein